MVLAHAHTRLSHVYYSHLNCTVAQPPFEKCSHRQVPGTLFIRWLASALRKVDWESDLPTRLKCLSNLGNGHPFLHRTNLDLSDDCLICYRPFAHRISDRTRIKLICGHENSCRVRLQEWTREGKDICPQCRKTLWHLKTPITSHTRPNEARSNVISVRSGLLDSSGCQIMLCRRRMRPSHFVAMATPLPCPCQQRTESRFGGISSFDVELASWIQWFLNHR
jgi:hypothetical protein